ncbi:MAG: hypothetical protein N2445_05455 [Acidobacteria bacterium]|nr:hypothetical protein [Acidobacteriota bacterium]
MEAPHLQSVKFLFAPQLGQIPLHSSVHRTFSGRRRKSCSVTSSLVSKISSSRKISSISSSSTSNSLPIFTVDDDFCFSSTTK